MTGVFDGLRVLDLSWGTAGPMTTAITSTAPSGLASGASPSWTWMVGTSR